ncbi:hypothetical protein QR685DRAFT_43796 [Neurospora intermedia]|uniref:Uncharacterized protein n=1 Tax=Neurospora intermedia TaxID=5142 RepID=A0ABR3DRL8_NEUIN
MKQEVGAGASVWLCPDCERPGLLREATDTSNESRAETLIEEDRERKGKNKATSNICQGQWSRGEHRVDGHFGTATSTAAVPGSETLELP